MGNESCDLDSAVSALVYAYLLYNEVNAKTKGTAVIPLFNICKKDLPLKTEVTYYLKKNSVPLDLLVFQLGISDHFCCLHFQDSVNMSYVLSTKTKFLCP
jgi:inorganic pyrophosphatase/exopolyphosphatase